MTAQDDTWETPEPTEVVIHREDPEFSFPLVTGEQIKQAEESVEAIKKIKLLALRVTTPHDWVDMGGKPYLAETGCMKIARLFGVSFTDLTVEEVKRTEGSTTVYRYIATCTARFNGGSLEVEGAASSDDDFFSMRNGERLPIQDINLNNIRKKATTNAQSRALKKILGLGGLTWEDVRGAGVEKSATASVRYKGQKAAHTTEGADTRTRIGNMLADLAPWYDKSPEELLDGFSGFESGGRRRSCKRVEDLSDKWAASTLKKVEEAWRAMEAEKAGGREPGADG
jgi:hypothetical protein